MSSMVLVAQCCLLVVAGLQEVRSSSRISGFCVCRLSEQALLPVQETWCVGSGRRRTS